MNKRLQKAKSQETKNARIPQNELFDLLYECFGDYNYWSFKTLKAKVRQPDEYLKSTLEVIAELVKTGHFANHWTLKAANKVGQYSNIKDELAPELEDLSDLGEDDGLLNEDEDDEAKMEDF